MDKDLEVRFTYHPPRDPEDVEFYAEYRRRVKEVAAFLLANTVPGREQSLALTKLEEAVMWGNAGRARKVAGLKDG
jgi:hypothetical protein